MATAAETFRTALQQHQQGEIERAQELYRQVLVEDESHAGAWHLLGAGYQQLGDSAEAMRCIGRALALDDSKAIYHNNYGTALRSLHRLPEAQAAFSRAIALAPGYADAHSNLGLVLLDQGNFETAEQSFQTALRLQPKHVDAQVNYGLMLQALGRHAEALESFRKAIELQPTRAELYNNLGNTLLAVDRVPEAADAYQKALALRPQFAEAQLNVGAALANFVGREEAEVHFEKARSLQPKIPLWQLRTVVHCPTIFQSVEALDAYRARLERVLNKCRDVALPEPEDEIIKAGIFPSFNLAHHGRNDRSIKQKFGDLFHRGFHPRNPQRRRGKPRIGFLATRGYEGGLTRGMRGVIDRLDPARFQPVILCSQASVATMRKSFRRPDVEYVGFPDTFSLAASQIEAAGCDVLYHWQIGSDALNYFLAFPRLAPVQCTSWGTHVTSGVPNIDYYLASKLVEPDDAQQHFSERLWLLDSLLVCHEPLPTPPAATRQQFGLPESGPLYMCLQRLNKFHPELDELFTGILRADSNGYIVAVKGRHEHALEQLKLRYSKTMPDVMDRVLFVPSHGFTEYLQLLALGDVALDIPHFGGGYTAYDAFSLAVPLVTLPGPYHQMGRYPAACYRQMGILDPIATSPEDYVQKAVRLGTDADYNAFVRAALSDRSHILFNDLATVAAFEDFFQYALDTLE